MPETPPVDTLVAQIDAVMLRRAANACRSIQQQAVGPRDWFDWVPRHLEWLADQIEADAQRDGPEEA